MDTSTSTPYSIGPWQNCVDEFELIRRFFTREYEAADVRVGVGDDGALLRPTAGKDLLCVVDTIVAGVHFPLQLAAADVGYHAVSVNLSDIAAMGGRPRWMTLALTLTEAEETWLRDFAGGLFEAADEHGVKLVGGDTTEGPTTVVTVQIVGDVAPENVLRRTGARVGDGIYVSGTLGDAAAGLSLIQQPIPETPAGRYLMQRFSRPSARVALGQAIAPLASAAIDLSDGLTADARKLLQASQKGGIIELDKLPLSAEIRQQFAPAECVEMALRGGDDYELCFTTCVNNHARIMQVAAEQHIAVTRIGEVTAGDGLVCHNAGKRVDDRHNGYRHFAAGPDQ